MKTVISEIACGVCGETRVFQADFETEDEKEARRLHADSLKHEILDFYTIHSNHQVEYTPILKPIGDGEEAKIRAAAAYCNWLLEQGYFNKETTAD